MSERDRARAVLYGLALGDSLGWPIEFLDMKKIRIIHGEHGIQQPPDPARYSDETQMSIAIAEALIEAGDADTDTLMRSVTRHLITWSNSPENTRAPGHTVTEAIRTLEAGVSWRESGSEHAKGNGSAIRVAPIGFFYQHDPEKLREVAHATGLATHAHPADDAAALAAAHLVKLALDGRPADTFVNEALSVTEGMSEDFHDAMLRIGHALEWTDRVAAMEHIGSGWIGEEAVAMAAYCVARYPDDFAEVVRCAANIPGDSDSVAGIAGGLAGAVVGLDGIPGDWVKRLENFDLLTDVADRLAAKKESVYGS